MNEDEIDAGQLEKIPDWIMACPISCNWVKYKGEIKFAMLNYERSIAANQPMIDLCYCATTGLINGRVEKTVRYDAKKFKMHKTK
jgi:hypothetical protein